jgi:hypothetical protein
MASILDKFIMGLGQQNAPFGFAPPSGGSVAPSQSTMQQDPSYQAGWQTVGDIGAGMLARGNMKPMQAFGQSYLEAKGGARERSKDAMVAQQMMAEAEANRQKQEEERQKRLQMEQAIAQLPPEQQAIARMMPEKFFGEQIEQKFGKSDGVEYGLNPVWAKGPDGQWGLFQPNKAGSAPQQMQFPEGYAPAPPVSFQDLGTSVQAVSQRGGVPIGDPMQKDLAGAESQKAEGKAVGEDLGDLPGAQKQAEVTSMKIDRLINDPNLDKAVGWTSYAPDALVPNSVISVRGQVRELMGGAFLEARQMLKGGGQITDYEGKKAEAAYTRMETAIRSSDPNDFKQALADFKQAIADGVQKLSATARTSDGSQGEDGWTTLPNGVKIRQKGQ